jgi:hypothetical protein
LYTVVNKFTEPIYENVPLPWNSKEVRSRASSVQSAPEIKSPNKIIQQVLPVQKDIFVENPHSEIIPTKNNALDMSSNSVNSLQVTSTLANHSAEQSFGKFSIIIKFSVIIELD